MYTSQGIITIREGLLDLGGECPRDAGQTGNVVQTAGDGLWVGCGPQLHLQGIGVPNSLHEVGPLIGQVRADEYPCDAQYLICHGLELQEVCCPLLVVSV